MKTPTNPILIATLFCLLYFVSSCSLGKQDEVKVSVISLKAKSPKSHYTVSPQTYYSKFNFLVDSSGLVYYYCLRNSGFTKTDENGLQPSFIYLTPEQMVQVTSNSVIDFLKCNILNDNKDAITISLSSQKDSIKSMVFDNLIKFLYDSVKNVDFQIRPTTIEENIVMNFKKRNTFYDPKTITWDSTKIAFTAAPNASSNK